MAEKLCDCLSLSDKYDLTCILSDIKMYLNDDIEEFNNILVKDKTLNKEDREFIEEVMADKKIILNKVENISNKVENTPRCE